MIKPYHLLAFLLLGAGRLYAQVPQQTLGAPVADQKLVPGASGSNSSLGSIYSPSLYDAAPISTSPFTITVNDYGSFGLSISYNTKGVKVNDRRARQQTGSLMARVLSKEFAKISLMRPARILLLQERQLTLRQDLVLPFCSGL